MSKNITIAEGTQAKNFNNVAKIRTNVIGGGTQNWIPEEEAGAYANLGEASIDENGTYRASEEGLDGFSKVTVNVPDSGATLVSKTITENGTYYASEDGADGYSQVTVGGIGEATVTLDEPIGGDGNEHHIKTNPTTGKVEDVVLPSYITITKMPNKMDYIRGESIDITGMVVKGFKKDNTIWESTGYSGGVIPNSELTVAPNVVTGEYAYREAGGLGYSITCTRPNVPLYMGFDAPPVPGNKAEVYEAHLYEGTKIALACFHNGPNDGTFVVAAADGPMCVEQYTYWSSDNPWGGTKHNYNKYDMTESHYERDGKPVFYWVSYGPGFHYEYVVNSEFNEIEHIEDVINESRLLAWVMIYGDVQNVYKQTESVSWKRPKDNEVLKTEFTVHAVER